jgi:hypothetical protein
LPYHPRLLKKYYYLAIHRPSFNPCVHRLHRQPLQLKLTNESIAWWVGALQSKGWFRVPKVHGIRGKLVRERGHAGYIGKSNNWEHGKLYKYSDDSLAYKSEWYVQRVSALDYLENC